MRKFIPLGLLLLAGCGETTQQRRPQPLPPPPPKPINWMDRVMGHDAKALLALLGKPALDLHEGAAHKLQFRGRVCVLDAYLYRPASGGEPKVTWIDARTPAGVDYDRGGCIAALAKR